LRRVPSTRPSREKERARIKENGNGYKRAATKFSDEVEDRGKRDLGWDPICEKEVRAVTVSNIDIFG
jgi:hypothetical protein